jgi:hypothetical protein
VTVDRDAGPIRSLRVRVTALPDGWSLVAAPTGTGGEAASTTGGRGADAAETGRPLRVEVDAGWRVLRVEHGAGDEHLRLTSDGAGRWWRDGDVAPELAHLDDVDAALEAAGGPRGIGRLVDACRRAAEPSS